MTANGSMPENRRAVLLRVATDLHDKYMGVFGQETIEALVFDSYWRMAANATITDCGGWPGRPRSADRREPRQPGTASRRRLRSR